MSKHDSTFKKGRGQLLALSVALGILSMTGMTAVQAAQAVPPNAATSAPEFSTIVPKGATYAASRSWFAALPESMQNADSGLTVGGGILHQHYAERDAGGGTLDSERGSIPSYHLGLNFQGAHFGAGVGLHYANGSDHYDGFLQSCGGGQCVYTPAQSTTKNKMLDAIIKVDYGFSPIHNLGIIPEVFLGEHVWQRDFQGVGAYQEHYNSLYYGGGLKLQYVAGPVVLGLEGRLGRTFAGHLDASILPVAFTLGDRSLYSVGINANYAVLPWLGIYASDTYGSFSYGASDVVDIGGGLTAQEPRSRTQQNVAEIGIKLF